MLNLEWQNTNSLRAYPLREGTSGVSDDGKVLPTNAFLDLSGFVPSDLGTRFYISSIEIEETLITRVAVANFDTQVEVGAIRMFADFGVVTSYELIGSGLGVTGRLVVGPGMLDVQLWGVGVYTFSPEASELEGNTLIPLSANVVTSVGILGQTKVLVGDVKLRFDRAMTGETNIPGNSLIISAVKRIEDCEPDETGCPIKSINGLYPDAQGNLVITAEGILRIFPGLSDGHGIGDDGNGIPGLIIDTIIQQDALCNIRQFTPALRGVDGGTGGSGPAGGAGGATICTAAKCCECEECDTCENYEGTFFYEPPQSMGALIGGGPPGAGGGFVGGGLVIYEGNILRITGVNFKVMNDGGPGSFDAVTSVIFCKLPCGSATAVPTVFTGNYLECPIPPGITVPPSTGDQYGVYLETYWGYTKPLYITILPAVPVQIENFDPPSLPAWADLRGPGFLFSVGNQIEGAGAFEVRDILPFGVIVTTGPLSGLGAPPWNLAGFSTLSLQYAKEFDPLEGGPADFVQIQLKDSFANTTNIIVPVPLTHRFPAPHVFVAPNFNPLSFPLPPGPANLADIVFMGIGTVDFGTGILIDARMDDLQGIP